jgi:hypothetical protein
MPYVVSVGESYTVPENFQGLFTVPITIDGELEVNGILAEVGTAINSLNSQIIFDDNGELTGNTGFTFDTVSGNLAVPGSATVSSILTNNYYYANGQPLSFSTIANGTSNVAIVTNGNVTTSVAGNANILTVTGTGANIVGTFNATGNSTLGNLSVSGVVSSNLIPASNGTQSLGNATNLWSNLYLSGNTIYLDSQTISATETGISMGTGNLTGGNITTTGIVTGALIQTTTTSLASNITIATSSMAIGPITIPTDVNATVNTGVRWVIF